MTQHKQKTTKHPPSEDKHKPTNRTNNKNPPPQKQRQKNNNMNHPPQKKEEKKREQSQRSWPKPHHQPGQKPYTPENPRACIAGFTDGSTRGNVLAQSSLLGADPSIDRSAPAPQKKTRQERLGVSSSFDGTRFGSAQGKPKGKTLALFFPFFLGGGAGGTVKKTHPFSISNAGRGER